MAGASTSVYSTVLKRQHSITHATSDVLPPSQPCAMRGSERTGLHEGKASRSHIHKLAKVSRSPKASGFSAMSAPDALEQAKAQGLDLLRACCRAATTAAATPTSRSLRTVLEPVSSRCHHRSREEALEAADVSRFIRPRAVYDTSPAMHPQV